MIDFIYFDLGNVILGFDHDRGCRQISELAGVSEEIVRSAIFDENLDRQYDTGTIDSDEFHRRFCESARCSIGKHELLHAASNIFTPNLAIFPLITQLRSANLSIGLLSNTCEAHWEFVRSRFSILRSFFSPIILSYEVHAIKPDREIYERAIAESGASPQRCFFVDDMMENVNGATAAGMDAVLYRSVPELVHELERRGVAINL